MFYPEYSHPESFEHLVQIRQALLSSLSNQTVVETKEAKHSLFSSERNMKQSELISPASERFKFKGFSLN